MGAVRVDAVDVNGAAIKDVKLEVEVDSGAPVTVAAKGTVPLPESAFSVTLRARHSEFNSEEVSAVKRGTSWQWNNPVCTLSATGADLGLTLTLGRMRCAPIVQIKPTDAKPDTQYDGILAVPDFRNSKHWRYRGLEDGSLDFRAVEHPMLANAGAKNWARMRATSPAAVDPAASGLLVYVEYGPPPLGRPRYLVALWMPSVPGDAPLESLDALVYLSPPTGDKPTFPADVYPHGSKYPYRTNKKADQSYVLIPQRYFFREHYVVFQVLAAKKRPVVVMPIFPATTEKRFEAKTDWGPFTSEAGLMRLLRETALFLHREYLTRPPRFRSVTPELRRAGASVRSSGVSTFTRQPPVPPPHAVAVATFSAGAVGMNRLLTSASPATAHFASDPKAFAPLWTDLWPIDLSNLGQGLVDKAVQWRAAQSGRRLRFYHTEYTGKKNWLAGSKLAGKAKPTRATGSTSTRWAEELHAQDRSWTGAYFSNEFLKPDSSPREEPPYGGNGSHDFVANFAVGHATALSGFS